MRWDSGIPAWHARAKCAHVGAAWWWDDPVEGKIKPAERLTRAVALCQDCPVASQCAAEAIEQHSVGVTRAGVPILSHALRPRSRRLIQAMLHDVIAGSTPAEAALNVYGLHEDYEAAVVPLQSILCGDTPLPGTDTPLSQTVPFTDHLTAPVVVRRG